MVPLNKANSQQSTAVSALHPCRPCARRQLPPRWRRGCAAAAAAAELSPDVAAAAPPPPTCAHAGGCASAQPRCRLLRVPPRRYPRRERLNPLITMRRHPVLRSSDNSDASSLVVHRESWGGSG
eukprot:352281-Chlamydomonas_euryale.AAC.7